MNIIVKIVAIQSLCAKAPTKRTRTRKNAILNLNHQEQDLRLFEIGKVYIPLQNSGLPNEIRKIAATATGTRMPEFWGKEEFDFFDFKSILEKGFESLMIWDDVEFHDAQEIVLEKTIQFYRQSSAVS